MIVDLIKGFYPYFGLLALLGICIRLRNRTWSASETILLSLVLVHAVLMAVQMRVFADDWKMSRRYLLPVAPLLFVWSALMLDKAICRYRQVKWLLPLLIVFLIFDAAAPALRAYCRPKKSRERQIVSTFSAAIKKDYNGALYYQPPLSDYEYRSPQLPIVQSPFPSLGYFAGGKHATKENGTDAHYSVYPEGTIPTTGWVPIQSVKMDKINYILWKKNQ